MNYYIVKVMDTEVGPVKTITQITAIDDGIAVIKGQLRWSDMAAFDKNRDKCLEYYVTKGIGQNKLKTIKRWK